MLKQQVNYTDFDGTEKTKTFLFHMTEVEIIKALMSDDGGIENRWKNALASDSKERVVLVFDELVRLSIGKIDDDFGFTKTQRYTDGFMASEAYNQMFKDIFADVKLAVAFFNGIFPKKVLEQAKADFLEKQNNPDAPKMDSDTMDLLGLLDKQPANEPKQPKEAKLGHEYTIAELKAMTDEEFAAWDARTPPREMRDDQLRYAYSRKAKK